RHCCLGFPVRSTIRWLPCILTDRFSRPHQLYFPCPLMSKKRRRCQANDQGSEAVSPFGDLLGFPARRRSANQGEACHPGGFCWPRVVFILSRFCGVSRHFCPVHRGRLRSCYYKNSRWRKRDRVFVPLQGEGRLFRRSQSPQDESL